jgi:quercetin dioxygenase-like cupin family protein
MVLLLVPVKFTPNAQPVDKGNGVDTVVMFQNYGPGGMFRMAGLVGVSQHHLAEGATWKSEMSPDVHANAAELFQCLSGQVWVATRGMSGEIERHELREGEILVVLPYIQHWGGAEVDAVLQTTLLSLVTYEGETPWLP